MKINPVYIDMESFWSVTHTLSKMTNIEYVMHPETEIISMCMKVGNNGAAMVYFGEAEIKKALATVDWSKSMVIGHNMSGFDALILAWRFGINPKMWGCTLAMARSKYNADVGGSLSKLVAHFKPELEAMGISGVKDSTALINTKGRHLKDFTKEEIKAMAVYNKDDTEQCAGLFKLLAKDFPSKELLQVDLTTRMLTEPQFVVDSELLRDTLTEVQAEKLRSLKELTDMLGTEAERVAYVLETGQQMEEFTKTQLMSSAKFAALLESRSVEVPMKDSPTNPGKQIPALSKTDEAFLELQEHDDPIVAAAARARLEAKSTLLETRIGKFLEASGRLKGKLPMPLRYAGAATTGRWSGEIFNPQNLPRIDPTKPKLSDCLRNALIAPSGYMVVTSDLSGIELRINHFLWQVRSSMKLFDRDPAKADLYREFAANLYTVEPHEVTKNQRQIGKIAHLGLGFGAGAATFQRIAKMMGGVSMEMAEAQDVTDKWREEYSDIYEGWRTCHNALTDIYNGNERPIDPWGMCKTGKDHIALPSGRKIWYPGVHQETGDKGKKEWWYGTGRNRARIYAGKVDENCIAEGTEVLTRRGWVPIENITIQDEVHDGIDFVYHGGIVNKSVQSCIVVDGVLMTPDHEVLTHEGWQTALENPRPYRPDLRSIEGIELGGYERTPHAVEVSVHLREAGCESGSGRNGRSEARGDTELRMYDTRVDRKEEPNARHVEASGIRGVPIHDRPLQTSDASIVGELRRPGDNGLPSLAGEFRELLEGHGADVSAGSRLGSRGQRTGLLRSQLQMDYSQGQHDEQAQHGNASGHTGAEPSYGDRKNDPVQQTASWVAGGVFDNAARLRKPVYDILNCGPNHRFVVRGAEAPFIVHNCVQALAADVLRDVVRGMYLKHDIKPALLVHDEYVCVVKIQDAERVRDQLDALMRAPTAWWPALIKWSESGMGYSYGEAH